MSVALLWVGLAAAADPAAPHPHRILSPITQAPAPWALDADQQARLARGEVVVASERSATGGSGRAVQVLNASADAVWDAILDYDRYPERVDSVVSATVYERSGTTFCVDMQSRILGITTVIYSRNALHRDEGWMAWGLDRRRTSDVQDMVGYWRVETLSTDPPRTRVEQQTVLAVSHVPGFVLRHLTEQSLADGLAWVKAAVEHR